MDTKISDLVAVNAITDADLYTVVQSGVNYKATQSVVRESLGGVYRSRSTVSSASLLTLGSVPVTIVAAPGANKYLNIISIAASYNYGTVAYVFASTESPAFRVGAGNFVGFINYTTMNGGADFNAKAITADYFANMQIVYSTNTALTFTTQDGGNPTAATGDGDLDVVVLYTIEDVNL